MISNCGSDENKRYRNGVAGDQTGKEWHIINWYSRPWNVILRHPDAKVRKEIAKLAKAAAKNDKVGYDQGERQDYWKELENVNYDPAKITTPCETDCSAGVLANIKAVGYRLNIQELKDINQKGYTGNMKKILTAAGFKAFTAAKYLNSDEYLLEGDILLNEGKHAATNLSNGTKSGASSSSSTVVKYKGKVQEGQAWLNSTFGSFIINTTGALLDEDNKYGQHSRWAALAVWKDTVNDMTGTKLTVKNKNFLKSCKAAAKKVNIANGSNGILVYIAQFILAAKGFYTDALDGKFGKNTKSAVEAFQKSLGLEADGVIGSNTWYALFN